MGTFWSEMAQDSDSDGELPESPTSSSDWIDSIDRRGLIHVNEQAHVVFSAVEEVCSTYVLTHESKTWGRLRREKMVNLQRKLKQMMMYNCIGQNLVNMPAEVAEKLLKMIIESGWQ